MSKLLKTLTVGALGLAIALSVSSTNAAAAYTFTAPSLTVGSRGEAVRQLQIALNMSADTRVAVSGAGSPGNETSYFGPATRAAVSKYQVKYGISPTAGFFGPLTMASLNAVLAGGTPGSTVPGCSAGDIFSRTTGQSCAGGSTPVPNGSVAVSLSASNTPAGSIVAGSATAELARFTFSGTGVVTNVKLQRIGLSTNNSTLQNVYLYSGATRLTDSGSVASDGSITFNNPVGLFTVSGPRDITVRADLVPVASGGQTAGTVGVALTSYGVSGNIISTSLTGNQMVIVNTTPASATFSTSVSNPASGATVNAGTNNFTIWSNQISISTRSVWLRAATFKYIGSAPSTSLSNIKLFVDGSQIGSTASITPINGTNYIVFDLTSMPYTLTTGSHTLEVRADVVGGASYSFTVSVQNAADLMLEDSQLPGTFISAGNIPTNTAGNSVTVNQGTNSVTVDPAFTVTNITGGATNIPIAQYKFTGYGEDVKITSLSITPTITGATPSGSSLQNVSLYANGAQIGSTANYSGTGAMTFNLGSSFIIPSGQAVTLTVKADLIASSSVNYSAGTLSVALTGIASNAQGLSSQQLFSIPGSANTPTTVTSNSLTIGANTITVAQNSNLTNQSVAPNTANQKIGSYVIQAGNSEGLQVTNLSVGVISSAGVTNLSNLKVVGNGISVNPVNPQATNNFSVNFTIPTSQSATVDVYADIGATTGTASTTLIVTGRGIISNVSTTTTSVAGQNTTIAQGGVSSTPTVVSSATLPAQYIIGPSSPTVVTYNFVATSSAATIQELRFGVTSSLASNNAISSITISGGGFTASSPVVSGTSTISGLSIPVPAGYGGVNITVTPTYTTVGGTNGITSNSTSTITLGYVKSISGNASTIITPAVVSSTMTLVSTRPTLAIASPSVNLSTGLTEIADITISADSHGAVKVTAIPITVQSSGNATATGTIAGGTFQIQNAGGTVISTATDTGINVTAGSSGSDTISFSGGGYQIAAGTSETFRLFATTAPGSGTAGQNQLGTKLGTSGFTWTDVNGNVTGLGSALIPTASYPATSAVIHN